MFTSKPQTLHPVDGGSVALRNTGILPHQHRASEPRRPQLKPSSQWKPQILHVKIWLRNLKERDHLEDIGIDWRVVL